MRKRLVTRGSQARLVSVDVGFIGVDVISIIVIYPIALDTEKLMHRFPPNLRLFGALGCLVLTGACDCGEPDLVSLKAQAALPEDVLDFGEVPVGASLTLSTPLVNDGNVALLLEMVKLTPHTGCFAVEVEPNPVPALGSSQVRVRFRPLEEKGYLDSAQLVTNSDENPVLTVQGRGVAPLISVVPSRHDFGPVELLQSRRFFPMIKNQSSVDHAVLLQLTGQGGLHYSMESAASGGWLTVPAFGSADVVLTFAPLFGGEHHATLVVEFCGEGCGTAVQLQGQGQAPRAQVDPLTLDFGVVAAGARRSLVFSISNSGFGVLDVDSAVVTEGSSQFAVVQDPTPVYLSPGDTTEVEVEFTPSASGRQQGQVVVASNDPASAEGYIALVGHQAGAQLAVVPSVLEYGIVAQAGPHLRQVLVVNRGSESARVLGLAMAADTPYQVLSQLQYPVEIAAQDSLVLDVSFFPQEEGTHYGDLTLATDVVGAQILRVPLAGTWAQSGCILVPDSDAVRFGSVLVGSTSSRQLVVENRGVEPCEISWVGFSQIHINDPAISYHMTPTAAIWPGEHLDIEVRFAPTAAGLAKAALLVRSTDPEVADLQIGVIGTGARSGLVAAPPSLDFGVANVGCGGVERSVAISNVGETVIPISSLGLEPSGSTAFRLLSGAVLQQLAPGRTHVVSVHFEPTQQGVHSNALVVTTGPQDVGLVVPMVGTATDGQSIVVTETFVVPAVSKVDVLFVIDNSGSMNDNQQNLANNFDHFIQYADFRGMQVDYQIGITTTDTTALGEGGQLVGDPKILTQTTPNLEQRFADRVQVGVGGSGHETGFDAAFLALSPPLIDDPTYNRGMLRRNAALAVVVVSDEDDNSPQPVEFYTGFVEGLNSGTATRLPVSFHAVTGGPNGCEQDGVVAHPAPRYDQAVTATGGQWMSLCAADWGAELENLGATVFLARGRFQLQGEAVESTLVVTIDGVGTTHYTYDAASKTLAFDPEHIPAAGANVEVSYEVLCAP